MESSDAWIKRKCFLKSLQEIEEIRNFSLLWNYFETEICEKNGKYEKVAQYVEQFAEMQFNKDQEEIIEVAFKYFKGRYEFDNQGGNELFETLGLPENLLQLLREELKESNASVHKKLIPLLKIAFRFRNNFFHGIKEIGEIKKYNQPFQKLNEILVVLNNLASNQPTQAAGTMGLG